MKKAIALCFGFLFALLPQSAGAAEKYPSKPIEYIMVSSPGSGAALFGQTVGKLLSEILKVPVNVTHKPAGNGNMACDYTKNKPADGYTMINWSSSYAGYMNFSHFQSKPEDFTLVCQMQKTVYSLVVNADSPFKTVQELIGYARENPGKLSVGSSKMGNPQHMNIINFCNAAGITVNYVPYNGTGEALKDVLGAHLDVGEIQPFLVLSHVASGKVRVLLTFNEERLPEMPDVPVPSDLGLNYPFFHQSASIAIKAGTPPERVKILRDALRQVYDTPEFKAYASQSVGMIPTWKGTEEYTAEFLRDYHDVGKVIRELNLDK